MLAQKIGLRGLKKAGILVGDDTDLLESNIIRVFFPHGLGHLLGLNVHDDGLGLVVQIPPKFTSEAAAAASSSSSVQFHSLKPQTTVGEQSELPLLPPPSSRRHQAIGVSTFATPTTKLEPGMLLTVEPGIYFNPAQIEHALQSPYQAQYLDEPTLKRYMSVGGVRIEDVVLIAPNGSVDNITTAPKDPKEIEQIVQQGQREYKEMCERDLLPETGKGAKKQGKATVVAAPDTEVEDKAPMERKKKRVGVFKKLIRAIRNLF